MIRTLRKIRVTIANRYKKVKTLLTKVFLILKMHHEGKGIFHFFFSPSGKKLIKKFFKKITSIVFNINKEEQKRINAYSEWKAKNAPTEQDIQKYSIEQESFKYKPVISILVPVYNTPANFLEDTVQSVLNQVYPHWELCLADDCSPSSETKQKLKELEKRDTRIKIHYSEKNGHISAASNAALSIASGEFCALLDHDDFLTKDALYQVALLLNNHPEADFIYSDEDKTDGAGIFLEPHFKPAWSPDILLSRNYIGHLVTMRSSLLRELGGFALGMEGSQDYDIYLRFTEKTKNIFHIPKILYNWRMHENSVALNSQSKPYAYIAGQRAIEAALERRGESGTVIMHTDEMLGFYTIRYSLPEKPLVSIIIPAKDKPELLRQCIESIFAKTTYQNFEIIVVDNGSTDQTFLELVGKYEKKYPGKFTSYPYSIPFNFSKLINFGVEKSNGSYYLLLNNDTEVITPDWIEGMLEQAQRPSIGVVGVKLLFPDDNVQHAGIIFNEQDLAYHIFSGDNRYLYNLQLNSINNYPAVTGACIMIRKELFFELGKFDEKFAVEYNDVDFCLRAIEKGYFNIYLPHVELYHHESVSRGYNYANAANLERHFRERELFHSEANMKLIRKSYHEKLYIY